ncbi:MAG TPA: HAD hydrolase-like protein [Bryobacteraceae bacterium]|nr:HAD hydrolase-like protein [Bryobacteraceae bacterium]
MQPIQAILFEPIGCLAEFPSGPFHEIAALLSGAVKKKPSPSGSRGYWHLLNLMEATGLPGRGSLELAAVRAASLYEDAVPALAELKQMGVPLRIASSLGHAALTRFVDDHKLGPFFDEVWSRDNAGGIKSIPIRQAAAGLSGAIFLTDTLAGLQSAQAAGVNAILMMNNPDEARRLAGYGPAGGIVSLHELPDFVRLLVSRGKRAVV